MCQQELFYLPVKGTKLTESYGQILRGNGFHTLQAFLLIILIMFFFCYITLTLFILFATAIHELGYNRKF